MRAPANAGRHPAVVDVRSYRTGGEEGGVG